MQSFAVCLPKLHPQAWHKETILSISFHSVVTRVSFVDETGSFWGRQKRYGLKCVVRGGKGGQKPHEKQTNMLFDLVAVISPHDFRSTRPGHSQVTP